MMMLKLTLSQDGQPIYVARDQIIYMTRDKPVPHLVIGEHTLIRVRGTDIAVVETPEEIVRLCGGIILPLSKEMA